MNDTLSKYNESQLATVENVHTEMAMVQKAETISSVLAAQAKAEVEARFIVAMNRPRDHELIRARLKKEIERPGFADAAWYSVPNRGEGFSIKFAEAALRNLCNIDPRSRIIYDDEDKMIIVAEVIDLETNVCISNTIIVEKLVERQFLKKGEVAISQRLNSSGKTVFLRRATKDEILPMMNSQISKSYRNSILRLLPGDIQDDCKRRILEIRRNNDAKDPDALKRQVCDSFDSIGIGPDMLKRFLGHSIDSSSPAELEELRNLYRNVKAGEVNFHEELEFRETEREEKRTKKTKLEEVAEKVNGETKK